MAKWRGGRGPDRFRSVTRPAGFKAGPGPDRDPVGSEWVGPTSLIPSLGLYPARLTTRLDVSQL